VIETSIGVDRTVMMVLSEAYEEQDLSTEEKTGQPRGIEISAKAGAYQTGRSSIGKKRWVA
jgi:glycyl-tRNA synthetase